ncbi:MAG TPA: hypothetical protein VGH83_01155 [Candidatus Acidoferrum sp.]|jgi:hypothetical protein
MPITPAITLTANLESILGGVATAGYLRITLCGFGPAMPSVPGVGMLADAGIPKQLGPQGGAPLSQLLWGNDVISPSGTFYEIAVLDINENAVQCGNYQFSGSGAIDLSMAPQIVAPYGFILGNLRYVQCTGAVPGTIYTAPGQVIAAAYNGILMRPGIDYTALGGTITLTFSTEIKPNGQPDTISAFCVVS